MTMHWTSRLSRKPELEHAIRETTDSVRSALGGPPDLIFLFASEHYRAGYDELPARVRESLGGGVLIGCSASGVIAGDEEIEFQPALGVIAARLPDTVTDCWHIEANDLAPDTPHSRKCAALAQENQQDAQFIILADPFSFPVEQLLHSLESGFAGATIAGGLASGGRAPGDIALFMNDATFYSGALMLSLSGNIVMDTAVAQGCRPVGTPMFVTSRHNGIILGLDGRPPLEAVNTLYERANERDRTLLRQSLFVGIAMQPDHTRYDQGDFLIRNIVGADQRSGAIQVAASLHPNQVVQFHLRDAGTSAEDLERVLRRTRDRYREHMPEAALLFSCTGRGEGLYGQSGHDSAMFRNHLGPAPLGGFFCNGEIGPVQGKTFLHGYTSAFALFRPRYHEQID
jgi:small ligand-binding sensory domain FIST